VRIRIKGFKSIEEASLDLSRVNVVIGPPESGKSNLLEALSMFTFLGQLKNYEDAGIVSRYSVEEGLWGFSNLQNILRIITRINRITDLFFRFTKKTAEIGLGGNKIELSYDSKNRKVEISLKGEKILYIDNMTVESRLEDFESLSRILDKVMFYRYSEEKQIEWGNFLLPPHGLNLLHLLKVNQRFGSTAAKILEDLGLKLSLNLEKLGSDKFERISEWIKIGMRDGFRRAIVVFNTVNEAIEFYRFVRENLDLRKDRILLLHSRFSGKDREAKMRRIEELRNEEYLLVSTQVIEAGVDISSDLFVSDLAPASSLIQRLGRFLRYGGEQEGRAFLWYEEGDGEKYKGVYDIDLFERTLYFLEGNDVRFHDPESYQALLDSVYDESSFNLKPRDVNELISIGSILESSYRAIEKFIELEGSFVRDSTLVPVVPGSLWREDMPISELRELLVPMNLSTVYQIKPKEMLVEEGKVIKKPTEALWNRKREHVLKYTLSSKFVAFSVEGDYDEELGMVVRYGEGHQLL
jgi:hypothetical protein